jgi:hypothetical protein
MVHTGINRVQVTKNRTLQLEQISSLTVSNYGATDIFVQISNIKVPVPAFNPDMKIPYVFTIDGDGTLSDIEITIGTDTVGAINAIVDYRKHKPQPQQC